MGTVTVRNEKGSVEEIEMEHTGITPNEYQREALRTEFTPDFINPTFIERRVAAGTNGDLNTRQLERLMHACMGGSTETGESWDMLKRGIIYGKAFDKVNVLEEAGDEIWYIALALDACGFTMEQAMERNIAKLRLRFPEKFTEAAALNRNLDAERTALEGNGK